MVVMITPVAFSSIQYRTYIIFAVMYVLSQARVQQGSSSVVSGLLTLRSNAFIVPVVYFFYPETAYRSLEEMDSIFHKTHSIFSVVRVAREEPRRYGKHGELLIDYEHTEEHLRRASHVSEKGGAHASQSDKHDGHYEHGHSDSTESV